MRKIKYNAPVTLTFSLLCLATLLLNYFTNGYTNQRFFSARMGSLLDPLTYFRLVSYIFGHASWDHFLGNISYVLLLGPMVEEKYGQKRLIQYMAVTAVTGAILNYIFFPNISLCGASGIVFMLIVLSSVTCAKDGTIPLTLILVLVVFVGKEIIDGIFVQDNISQLAHIAGGVCGAIFGLRYYYDGK